MKKHIRLVTILLGLLLSLALFGCTAGGGETVSLSADTETEPASRLTMPTVFADGMVLQRQKPINVFGYCETDGATVRATLDGVSAESTVSDGRFNVTLPATEAATDLVLTVELVGDADSTLTYSSVSVGEVWVISGQSNADHEAWKLEDVAEYVANANNYHNLYLYTTPNTYTKKPDLIGQGKWLKMDRSTLVDKERVSAHMYVTATILAAEIGEDIPIAVMNVAKTGSGITTWLDYETLYSIDRTSAQRFAAYDAFYDEHGYYPRSTDDSPYYLQNTTAKPYSSLGTICYNTYLAHLEGYSARGVVWHQGESNVGGAYGYYTDCFGGLLDVMRRVFGGDPELPMFQVQLSSYADSNPSRTAPFKAEQYDIVRRYENTYIISAVDGGTPMNTIDLKSGLVHSSRKSPIGIRCANSILANVYGINNGDYSNAPQPVSVVAVGSSIKITFDSPLYLTYGDKVKGFELYQNGGWYTAEGVIDGCTVTLSASGVTSPTRVRYGFGSYMLEMQDGTVYEMVGYEAGGSCTDIILANGERVTMYPDDGTRIRLMTPGNLSNASGEPLFIFDLEKEN